MNRRGIRKVFYVFSIIAVICSCRTQAQDFLILPNGHSHNDYSRETPLFDALENGFPSIEVDVFLHNGRMVVTHDDKQLDKKPTLEELYLDPLRKVISMNGGTVFAQDSTQLILMVDLKSDRITTYNALKVIFQKNLDLIEWYNSNEVVWGPIKVLLTGGPPIELIQKEKDRYFYVDGSVNQWYMDYPVNLMPRASTNYSDYFKWKGQGLMPTAEEQELKRMISIAHLAGRKIRFWGSPNKVEVWEKLLDEGADWINVDDLKGFNEFYRKRISITK